MFVLLLSAPLAHAFCGTYVGAEGDSLVNDSSQVVIAREGTTTSLTLAMDYRGDATEFALLLPVPEILGADAVSAVDEELIDWISAYTQPRTVQYTCDDVFATSLTMGAGCGSLMGCGGASKDDGGGATVESSFTAYGYDFVVLSAAESDGLQTWLAENGYAIPAGGEDILQEYIDGGSYFLAAKVSLDAVPSGNVWLTPIRLSYESEVFALPIRIGTISADGPQEVLIYTLTDHETGGEVGISNYPEATMETECLLPAGAELGTWYTQHVEDVAAEGGAVWIKEYSWNLKPEVQGGYHCDPCTAEAVAPGGSFAPFGLQSKAAHLTRLRMRYTPETATQDLVFFTSGITDVEDQLKYIEHNPDLEFLFPYCDTGWADDPGTCPGGGLASLGTTGARAASPAALLALAVLLRRRRRA